jgi:hypothetical protein
MKSYPQLLKQGLGLFLTGPALVLAQEMVISQKKLTSVQYIGTKAHITSFITTTHLKLQSEQALKGSNRWSPKENLIWIRHTLA